MNSSLATTAGNMSALGDEDYSEFRGSDEESDVDYDAPLIHSSAFKLLRLCQDEFMPSTPRKIAELLDAHPDAPTSVTTSSGYTVLHAVCENPSATYEAIESILRLHKPAVKQQSAFGDYPLHCICRNNGAIANEDGDTALELILAAFPGAAEKPDQGKELPLHWICRNPSATVNVVDEVWKAHTKAAAELDNFGRTPVDMANLRFKVLAGKFAEEAGLVAMTKEAAADAAEDLSPEEEEKRREELLRKQYEDGGHRKRVQNEQVLDEEEKDTVTKKSVCRNCGEPGHVERDCQLVKRGQRSSGAMMYTMGR
jgi:hypothetical protein